MEPAADAAGRAGAVVHAGVPRGDVLCGAGTVVRDGVDQLHAELREFGDGYGESGAAVGGSVEGECFLCGAGSVGESVAVFDAGELVYHHFVVVWRVYVAGGGDSGGGFLDCEKGLVEHTRFVYAWWDLLVLEWAELASVAGIFRCYGSKLLPILFRVEKEVLESEFLTYADFHPHHSGLFLVLYMPWEGHHVALAGHICTRSRSSLGTLCQAGFMSSSTGLLHHLA